MTRARLLTLTCATGALLAACTTNSATGGAGTDESAELEEVVVTGSIASPRDGRAKAEDRAAPVEAYAAAPPPPAPLARAAPPQLQPQPRPGDIDRERYEDVEINPVKLVSEEPVSTFSIDVDTASYANVRRFLNDGVLPPKDAVRIEELINYFDYTDYTRPETTDTPFASTISVVPSPWAEGRQLMQVGLQGYDIERDERPDMNLTLLVDVSGSMNSPDKLPLAVKALRMLVEEMDADDSVSIVVYAGAAGAVLDPTPGNETSKIIAALDQLSAGGSTAGGEGLRLAYSLARQNYDPDAINRVMILTDGDFNVGISDPERLEDLVSRERESGVYLSVIGFGTGNYNDVMMQKLAQAGNGMASYIDTLNEARKIFSDDLSGSLFPIANDVKIQIEFNPARIAEYRLIGYETRMLNREDFNNDKVDAGEIGAGHSVTAIYELTPVGSDARLIDSRRYAQERTTAGDASSELAFLRLRYKPPGEDASKLIERPITDADATQRLQDAPQSTRFATAVAAYGQLLRGDPYMTDGYGWDQVIALAQGARGDDPFGYRAEFVQLARLAKTAAAQETLQPPGNGGAGQ